MYCRSKCSSKPDGVGQLMHVLILTVEDKTIVVRWVRAGKDWPKTTTTRYSALTLGTLRSSVR